MRWLTLVIFALSCVACGGGTTQSARDNAVTTKSVTINMALFGEDGQATRALVEGERGTIQATVRERVVVTSDGNLISDSSGPLPNTSVAIAAAGGELAPAGGQVLTNSGGIAEAALLVGPNPGAFDITATVDASGGAEGSISYMVASTDVAMIELSLSDSVGDPVSQLMAGEQYWAMVTAYRTEVDASGNPLSRSPAASEVVVFGSDAGVFNPSNGQVITNEDGVAGVVFVPSADGDLRGEVTATVTYDEFEVSESVGFSVTVEPVFMGLFQASTGLLEASPPTTEAGGAVTVTGDLFTGRGLFTTPTEITVSSVCVELGVADVISPVLAVNGSFRTTFTPGAGCEGTDTVIATATLPGQGNTLTAQSVITVLSPAADRVEFVSLDPASIAIRGRGAVDAPERSNVTFRVVNKAGVPAAGIPVTFALTNTAGGLALQAPTAMSDVNGEAVALVNSGTAATTSSVIASIPNGAQTQSGQFVVSTAAPDSDSFSISVSTLNIEAWTIDGQTTEVTVRAADHFNNPVPDGTAIAFRAEGGSVTPNCVTTGGACSVIVTSQAPRPSDGRVTILATTVGDEAFVDANANGLFDSTEPFSDLPEPFVDANENGVRDASEEFVDNNNNGARDSSNDRYDGSLCNSGCGNESTLLGSSAVVVFSTSQARIEISPSGISGLGEDAPQNIFVRVFDLNGNLMPAGTTIDVTTDNGEYSGEASVVVGNSNARGPVTISGVVATDGEPSTGLLTVLVTSPEGFTTSRSITVEDTTVCDDLVAPLPSFCDGAAADRSVGSIELSRTTATIAAGEETSIAVDVFVQSAGSPPLPFQGAEVSVSCNAQTTGADIRAPQPAQTDTQGRAVITVGVDASSLTAPTETRSATCDVRAGDQAAVLTLNIGG